MRHWMRRPRAIMHDLVYEIQMRCLEDEESFIFEKIQPFCENVIQMKISKEELQSALILWQQAKKLIGGKEDGKQGSTNI